MTGLPDLAVLEISSPSSSSLDSAKDTPATRQTISSPEELSASRESLTWRRYSAAKSLIHSSARYGDANHGHSADRLDFTTSDQDPFTSIKSEVSCSHSNQQRLSATAHTFQPLSTMNGTLAYPLENGGSLLATKSSDLKEADASIMQGNRHAAKRSCHHLFGRGAVPDLMNPSLATEQNTPQQAFAGSQIFDGSSRYVMVTGIPQEAPRVYLDALLAAPPLANSRIAVCDRISSLGMMLLRYDDLRCAVSAVAKINIEFPSWVCQYTSSEEWVRFANGRSYPSPSRFEGHVMVSLIPNTSRLPSLLSNAEIQHLVAKLFEFMSQVGDLKFSKCILADKCMIISKYEFYSLKAADAIQHIACRWSLSETQLLAIEYLNRYSENTALLAGCQSEPDVIKSILDKAFTTLDSPAKSIIPTSHKDFGQNFAPILATQVLRQGSRCTLRTHEPALVGHNLVDIGRIKDGQDVRTTIMLRNIPNKVDQPMLKEIVDETSRGKYDFMYLRIDFANNCNVGYAFINFEDSFSIIDFVQAVAGKRWNRFNSDKIAEISYATIQGKDCLVQKFRNSSVMLEAPLFRPKIFVTGNGPSSGEEESFPLPDNHSKMRRSLENAEHVGLFAPRVGQRFRDEQRRRKSRYDRGTRFADIEESRDRWSTNLGRED